jgi:hypothetical protein
MVLVGKSYENFILILRLPDFFFTPKKNKNPAPSEYNGSDLFRETGTISLSFHFQRVTNQSKLKSGTFGKLILF